MSLHLLQVVLSLLFVAVWSVIGHLILSAHRSDRRSSPSHFE